MKSLIDIIIISYNTLNKLKGCLESIERNIYYPCAITIVDNASSDGSQEYIHGWKTRNAFIGDVHKFLNQENEGYAKAVNRGYKAGLYNNVVVCNADIMFTKDWDKIILRSMNKREDVALTGCKLVDPINGIIRGAGVFDYRMLMTSRGYGEKDRQNAYPYFEECVSVSGGWMLMKRSLINRMGAAPMDGKYNLYFEDFDLCCKIRKNGWRVFYHPHKIWHFHNSSPKGAEVEVWKQKSKERFCQKWKDWIFENHKIDIEEILFGNKGISLGKSK